MKKITVLLMLVLFIPSIMNAGVTTKKSFGLLIRNATNGRYNLSNLEEHLWMADSAMLYYVDADGDGYGSSTDPGTSFNEEPVGYSVNNTDCNDNNNQIHPDVVEICNSIDDNCNGLIDENHLATTISPTGTITFCHAITLAANMDAGITYNWYRNMHALAGETNSTCTITKRGNYRVFESQGNCLDATSIISAIPSPVPPAHIDVNGQLDICNKGYVTARANGGTNTPYTYQWLKSGWVIAGLTSRDITITSTGVYSVIVSNTQNCSHTSIQLTVFSSCREGDAQPQNNLSLAIYPNPSNGNFMVEMNLGNNVSTTANIEVLNMINQVIYSTFSTINDGVLQEQVKLDDHLTSGSYFVRVMIGDKVFTGRIVYQK